MALQRSNHAADLLSNRRSFRGNDGFLLVFSSPRVKGKKTQKGVTTEKNRLIVSNFTQSPRWAYGIN